MKRHIPHPSPSLCLVWQGCCTPKVVSLPVSACHYGTSLNSKACNLHTCLTSLTWIDMPDWALPLLSISVVRPVISNFILSHNVTYITFRFTKTLQIVKYNFCKNMQTITSSQVHDCLWLLRWHRQTRFFFRSESDSWLRDSHRVCLASLASYCRIDRINRHQDTVCHLTVCQVNIMSSYCLSG